MKHDEEEPEMFYNAGGLMVFTAEYLLRQGYCCGNGCRHCPYDYKAVPSPKKEKLLAERAAQNKENGHKN